MWVSCRQWSLWEEKAWREHRGSNVSLPGWMPRSHRLSEIYTLVLSLNSWKAPTAWEKLMASHQDTRYHRWGHPFIHCLSLGWPNRRRRVCKKKKKKKKSFCPYRTQLWHAGCIIIIIIIVSGSDIINVSCSTILSWPISVAIALVWHSPSCLSSRPRVSGFTLWELWGFHSPW